MSAIQKTLCICACLISIWAMGYMVFFFKISTLSPQKAPERAEAIVVLTGGPERIHQGFVLFSEKRAEKLLISGVNDNVTLQTLYDDWRMSRPSEPESAAQPQTQEASLIPVEALSCCVKLGYKAKNTHGNAAETRVWSDGESLHSLYVVTAYYHIPRAMLELSHAMPKVTLYPYPVTPHTSRPFSNEGLYIAFIEYHKVLLTWLRLKFKASSRPAEYATQIEQN